MFVVMFIMITIAIIICKTYNVILIIIIIIMTMSTLVILIATICIMGVTCYGNVCASPYLSHAIVASGNHKSLVPRVALELLIHESVHELPSCFSSTNTNCESMGELSD